MFRRRTESNKEIKQNERKQKRENMAGEDNDLGWFFELATSKIVYVNNLKLHGIKNELSQDYTGDFELNGLMIIGPIEHKTIIRFKNVDDFESFINAIDIDYDGEDVTFSGKFFSKLKIPQFKVGKRSAHGRGCTNMQEIVEYHGQTVIYQVLESAS